MSEEIKPQETAINVLQMIKHKEYMRKMRKEALRTQYIDPREITG
jgi:hypothetical protein